MIKYVVYDLFQGIYLCPLNTYDVKDVYQAIQYNSEEEAWNNANSYDTVFKIIIRE
jgi:hypothetical protein